MSLPRLLHRNVVRNVTEMTNNSLPEEPSMKKTVQRHSSDPTNSPFDLLIINVNISITPYVIIHIIIS